MKIKPENIKGDFRNIVKTIQFVYRSDKVLFIVRLVLIVLQSLLTIASLYALKLLIDAITIGATGSDFSLLWAYSAFFCGVFLFSRLLLIINQFADEILMQKLIDYVSNLINRKSVELDLSYYDNAEYHDAFHRAQQEANFRPVQILNNIIGIFTNLLSLIGIVVVLTSFSWVIITIVFVAGLPSLWVKLVKSRRLYKWRKENTPSFRKSNYYSTLLTNRPYAKEVRVNNLSSILLQQFVDLRKNLVKQIVKITKKTAKLDAISALVEAFALLAVIYLLAVKAYSGAISIGGFVMLFEAFRRGQGYIQGLVSSVSGVFENKLFMNNLFEFLKLKPNINSPQQPVPFPQKLIEGIRFENVSFSYPGSENFILRNVNLEIKPGLITHIQGENGAGKTTLIKLLSRLYDCTEGAIYIENINIKDFELDELRQNISMIFQDFCQFDMTVKENIAFGDVTDLNNEDKLIAAAQLSTAKQIIDKLPQGFETMLGKYFEKGEELSMGQWQRIALSRAMYSDAPILILDEPTSWIDAKAEKEFYAGLNHVVKNRTVIVINHSEQMNESLIVSTNYYIN